MTGPPLRPVDLGDGVRGAFTMGWSDAGGVGGGYNLSTTVAGGPELVARRLRALEDWVGAPVVRARQVHGSAVHVCEPADGPVTADALVAADPGRAVAVLVADCVPVLLADAGAGVVAAVHAGRRGLVAGVVGAAVAAMVDRGARSVDVRAVVGPAVCGACYEVPAELRDEVDAAVPGTASTTSWGTPALDLPAGVAAQLVAAGVARIEQLGVCTMEDTRYFSHRAVAAGRPPGRFAAVVRALG